MPDGLFRISSHCCAPAFKANDAVAAYEALVAVSAILAVAAFSTVPTTLSAAILPVVALTSI